MLTESIDLTNLDSRLKLPSRFWNSHPRTRRFDFTCGRNHEKNEENLRPIFMPGVACDLLELQRLDLLV
jgi:hypothetical protein